MPPVVLMLSIFSVDELMLLSFVVVVVTCAVCYNFSFELTLMWCEVRARM